MAYPAGGSPYQSTLATICWLAGLFTLVRRRYGVMLVLCLAPQAVTFVAAAMQRYPYGGHIRLNLYLAPFMCMVIGYGATTLLNWASLRSRNPKRPLYGFLTVLALVGIICMGRDLAGPYKNISDQRARGFAQWFWFNLSQEGEVACLTSDLGVVLSPKQYSELNYSAQYLCNQRIYSPRHAAHQPVQWDKVSATHPLLCVLFRSNSIPFDDAKCQTWQHEMQTKYDLIQHESLPVVRVCKMGWVCDCDAIEIFRYIPKAGTSPAATVVTQAP
jgi:hypothetical protein